MLHGINKLIYASGL